MMAKELVARLLGLTENWSIDKIEMCDEQQKLFVHVAFDPGVLLRCPVCGAENRAEWKRETKVCQYFSFFEYHTYIVAQPQWIACPQHGVHKIKSPWEEKIDSRLAFNKTI